MERKVGKKAQIKVFHFSAETFSAKIFEEFLWNFSFILISFEMLFLKM